MSIRCDHAGIEGPGAVISSHRTMSGHISYLRCHCGGVVVAQTRRYTGETQPLHHAAA